LASPKSRGWKLLVIPEDESDVRQFRLPRKAVVTLLTVACLLVVYAAVETVLFWTVARRAAEVEPLRRRLKELEGSSAELNRLGGELTRLKKFEQQLKGVLSGKEPGGLSAISPWGDGGINELPGSATPSPDEAGKSATSPVAVARSLGGLAYTAMDVPSVPPLRGYITRRFNAGSAHLPVTHRGLDIAARAGTPVLAAGDGLVVFADWTYSYGNLVVLAHRSGYLSFYGHNQIMFVKRGERVQQAQPVALVGTSGISTAPHLHFELWKDGTPVDPMTLLAETP
jgi:murein DD-endopeptidase MepM/ murein hydrolase activator NlpD